MLTNRNRVNEWLLGSAVLGFGVATTCLLLACGTASGGAPRVSATHADAASGPSASPSETPSSLAARVTEPGTSSSDVPSSVAPAAKAPSAFNPALFLSTLTVTYGPALEPDELRLFVRLADGPFGEVTRRALAREIQNRQITIRLPKTYPTSNDPVLPQHGTCSHVVDCDDAAVLTLGADALPTPPAVEDLTRFVGRHIVTKSLTRGFDPASEVARHREGDCTEHAVLLTALMRRYHLPARVVLGFVIARSTNQLPLIAGHAWTEVHDHRGWQLADAALGQVGSDPANASSPFIYLPVQMLAREDAAFQLNLLNTPGVWQVERAEVARPTKPEAPPAAGTTP
jgi:hypothetical protein